MPLPKRVIMKSTIKTKQNISRLSKIGPTQVRPITGTKTETLMIRPATKNHGSPELRRMVEETIMAKQRDRIREMHAKRAAEGLTIQERKLASERIWQLKKSKDPKDLERYRQIKKSLSVAGKLKTKKQ